MGIMPESIAFLIIDKADLHQHTMVPMQKGHQCHFSKSPNQSRIVGI